MAKNNATDNVPLSRFGVLVAQLESIVASASQKNPDPLLCFEILSDLISSIDEEPKESLLVTQRKCEDALYSLVTLGARRPVRHLASVAMAKIILNGDSISIYSRASSLQGFLSDGKRSDPQRVAGAAQCLGELYRHFGRKITSGLVETTVIVTKLVKFNEDFVRQEAFILLHNALEGCGGTAAATAYSEAYRLITRFSTLDKSFVVRIAAARCLKAFSNIGGPGLGTSEFDTLASYCVKGIEDSESSVRDAFAEALGSLLALGMHPEAHVQPRGKGPFPPAKKLEGGLQRHLILPFTKAVGSRAKNKRFGLALSWVFFLQAIRIRYMDSDSELQEYSLLIMDMLQGDSSIDAHALACVLYILRVGVIDQMMEPSQRSFSVSLGKQLQSSNASSSMKIVALRALSYTLKTLGEVPHEFKEFFDDTVGAALSHFLDLVRVEAALTLRALAEVDPTCIGGLTSFAVTTLNALRESLPFEKGDKLKTDLASLHGQAATLAALVSISPGLSLGYPARLPRSVLEVSKKMLTESRRNITVASSEKEAGWLLLSSLLNSMPKEEFGDQDFDILILWTDVFTGNPEHLIKQQADLKSMLSVWSAAIDALTAFIRRFVSCNDGILLQPVLANLRSALSCVSTMANKRFSDVKTLVDILIIRLLIAYQSIPDPLAYKSEHQQIVQLCTTPYRDPSGFEESSCLKALLDKRDAWLGPWIPGRDWFEDELRYFQGGEDGLAPSVWESKVSSFPLPETVKKTLVNQMVLCFGIMFASQDSQGMLSLLSVIQQCMKAGKKQQWRTASLTNICAGLLAGLKALHALRPQQLTTEVLSSGQAIFQNILTEGDICASQRRAACEGLGLLARLGNDIFTARMTRVLLGDLSGITDPNYGGSIALALGCIHHSAGGMALSSLVPATVSSVSSLAKTSVLGLKIWALHGLLLTIEAAGLSFVSHVQAALGLALDILLTEESGWIDLSQGIGRLINAIVAVLGPELSPGSILFSRCKSVIAEISSWQEIPTLLESVCFTQQLILFAPQAVSVHLHVKNLLMTLASRQPIIRRLSVSTLRHLIEKDPVSVIDEQIEDNLFQMLDEETDSEIGNLIRSTLIRLLYATCPSRPSRWMSICRNMALAASAGRSAETSIAENDPANTRENLGDDDEDMVSSSSGKSIRPNPDKDKTLRYRTRVFAAECLSLLPEAVGNDAAHFDILLARKLASGRQSSGDWLVLQLQELISLAYQISTIQFENMRPIGVGLLSTILEKFKLVADPELPGHLLLEQYQAQLVSAVRTALDANSGPVLLEAGLQLATKIMTSGIISSDQIAVKRIFSLLSRPLNDFTELYYPSFAEWVTSKIKIRLLAAHASLKCYIFTFLRKHHGDVPVEFEALLPLFSKSSDLLGRYWIQVLSGYSYVCLCQNLKRSCSFLDEIPPHTVSRRLQPCLEEAWPVILQALVLDAIPVNHSVEEFSDRSLISRHRMVTLEVEDYQFLWGFAVLVLFQGMHPASNMQVIPFSSAKIKCSGDSGINESSFQGLKIYEIALPVFQSLSAGRFFSSGFLSIDLCQELLQVFSYSFHMDSSWDILAVSVVQQISQNCPKDFLESEQFAYSTIELCLGYLFKILHRHNESSTDDDIWDNMLSPLFISIKTLVTRFELKMQHRLNSAPLAFLLSGYKCIRQVPTDAYLPKALEIVKSTNELLHELTRPSSQKPSTDGTNFAADSSVHLRAIFGACLHMVGDLTKDCINGIRLVDNKRSGLRKLLQLKLVFCLEQLFSLAKLSYEFDCPGDEIDTNSTCIAMLKSCQISIAAVIKDSNVQVQATVLQVLKSLVQRYNNPEEKSFVIFFVGELIEDIVSLMQRALLKPMNKESVVIAGECLRFIMLLQTHSITDELQRGFMSLFLEVVLVVFSKTSDGVSQEVLELRNVAVRLVSHLAQLPSSAVHFKDVLLSLPATHRQQLQDIIRASVSKDSALPKPKSLVPPMDIKLPAPVVATPEKVTSTANMVKAEALSTVPISFNQINTVESEIDEENDEEEDDDDDDDDWDTFQSFPASTNLEGSESKTESVAEEEPDLPGSSSIQEDESNETNNSLLAEEADDQHFASDNATDTTREDSNDKSKEVDEETVEPYFTTSEDSVDKSKEVEEETVDPCRIEEALTSQNDKTSSDDHPVESKNLESENIGTDIKLTSTEVDSPALDDTSDDLEPHQIQKLTEDESSKEHVGADVIVTGHTMAENKSEED
ncbi:HEAT repeat-containing protein 5B isoform X2 [Arabidopsis lyrata subsp. lyrata]|uniref:HEAT repeat-containing protein 5B isoform X2 n=1 Tax=Arabidopsis lyrata subsp. lyrata TaxID=81972 RepID=UPI000A29E91D|nr:HEAT repeat-containing protein 5B isoform X2 [Arabidopsis lyrata subsp. lyrata]|eukprot:XP_020890238.1 HEAT repeat-containing protein 5B isoform X2 [Arabidopsis lyrata subsp. lyrata]